jgi:hypothetical protein
MKSNLNRTLVIILIGNNLVNTGTATLATVVATEHFGHLGPGLAVGVITLLLLVFGEITPKTYATRYAIVVACCWQQRHWRFLANCSSRWSGQWKDFIEWMHSLSSPPKDPSITESELIALAAHGTQEGSIEAGEHHDDPANLRFQHLARQRHHGAPPPDLFARRQPLYRRRPGRDHRQLALPDPASLGQSGRDQPGRSRCRSSSAKWRKAISTRPSRKPAASRCSYRRTSR